MRTVTMTTLRKHAGEVMARVAGTPESLVVTQRGNPIALVLPFAQAVRGSAQDEAAWEEFLALQEIASTCQTEPLSVADLMEEERR